MGAGSSDCVFCKIAAGQIPCHRVFENEQVLAFLDIAPLSTGHTVVIPKSHAERLDQLGPEVAAEIARHLGELGRRVVSVTKAEGYNVLQNNGAVAGQVVPHVHFHIIPRRSDDGLGYRWNAKSAAQDELAALAAWISATA
jgi:histidine triad (HIT) family protein